MIGNRTVNVASTALYMQHRLNTFVGTIGKWPISKLVDTTLFSRRDLVSVSIGNQLAGFLTNHRGDGWILVFLNAHRSVTIILKL